MKAVDAFVKFCITKESGGRRCPLQIYIYVCNTDRSPWSVRVTTLKNIIRRTQLVQSFSRFGNVTLWPMTATVHPRIARISTRNEKGFTRNFQLRSFRTTVIKGRETM